MTTTAIKIDTSGPTIFASWRGVGERNEVRDQLRAQNIHVFWDMQCWCEPESEEWTHYHGVADTDPDNPLSGPWHVVGSGNLHRQLVQLETDQAYDAFHDYFVDEKEAISAAGWIARTCWSCAEVGLTTVPHAITDPDHIGLCDECLTRLRSY